MSSTDLIYVIYNALFIIFRRTYYTLILELNYTNNDISLQFLFCM